MDQAPARRGRAAATTYGLESRWRGRRPKPRYEDGGEHWRKRSHTLVVLLVGLLLTVVASTHAAGQGEQGDEVTITFRLMLDGAVLGGQVFSWRVLALGRWRPWTRRACAGPLLRLRNLWGMHPRKGVHDPFGCRPRQHVRLPLPPPATRRIEGRFALQVHRHVPSRHADPVSVRDAPGEPVGPAPTGRAARRGGTVKT